MRRFIEFEQLSRRVIVGALLTFAVAACDDDPAGPSPDLQPAENFRRVLVADATAASAKVIALHSGATLQTYTLAAPASLVYRSHSGRFGVIQQRTANRVDFLDGGVEIDDDIGRVNAPAMHAFNLQEGLPTHENVNGDWISVFFDGTGFARWIKESDLRAGTPTVAFQANTGAPHHGGSFTFTVNSQPFFATTVPNPAGGLPNGVAVRNQQGTIVSQVQNCPDLHGNNSIASGGVFGCSDGLVIVRANGASAVAEKVTPSGDMAGLGLRNAYTNSGASFILGQFSALPGQPTQRVLATINPATGAISRLPALPAGVTDHSRAVEPVQERIVLLGNNGSLYIYNASRVLQHTVASVVPALPSSGALPHQIALAENLAVVASPTTGELVLVNLTSGTVIRRINVGGQPARLALLGALGDGEYELED